MRFLFFLWLALVGLNPAAAQHAQRCRRRQPDRGDGRRGTAFEAARPGVRVQLRFGASGVLLQEIAAGQPADVFASADAETLARGIQRRLLVSDAQRDFATGRLVLIVPTDRHASVQRLQDLARPEIRRIAMGRTATVPAGRYARQAIDALRLWPSLQQKIVAGDSVRAVLEAVAGGDVDAGFVYATDAAGAGPRVRVVQVLDTATPVRYPATVVAASGQPALARDFVLFLNQPAARAIFERHGFGAP